MKVKELIEKLNKFDKELDVCTYDFGVQHLVDLKDVDKNEDVVELIF